MSATKTRSEAVELVAALDKAWARNSEYNLNALKKLPAAQAILKSPPELQAAVAGRILDFVAEFARQGKGKGNSRWFTEEGFPWGCVYFESSLLKKRLLFSESDLEQMLDVLMEIGFLSASQFEFLGSFAGTLERHAAKHRLSPRLRDAAAKFSDMLAGRGSRAACRLWDPDAADRKVAGRIDRLLAGPLNLG